MNCLINQPSGLGDILFTQKIASYYISKGYNVIWPVLPQLEYVKEYLKQDGLEFKDYTNQQFDLVLPLRTADRYFEGSWQHAKYKLVNLDWSDWAGYLKKSFYRNLQKESELQNHLNIQEDYTLVLRRYGTIPHCKFKDFEVKTDKRIIELDIIDGFTLFDWCGVIENASELWMVDSSVFYLIEILDIKAKVLQCFPRDGHTQNINGLFNTKWKIN